MDEMKDGVFFLDFVWDREGDRKIGGQGWCGKVEWKGDGRTVLVYVCGVL